MNKYIQKFIKDLQQYNSADIQTLANYYGLQDNKGTILEIAKIHARQYKAAHLKSGINPNMQRFDTNQIMNVLKTDSLADTDLSGADLRNANLSEADLSRSDLSRAKLTGADLNGITANNINLTGSKLNLANLNKAHLGLATLTGADLENAILTGADLTSANLIKSDLSNAYLNGANLSGADLTGAKLIATYLMDSILTGGAKLINVIAYNVNLINADLSNADLTNANLQYAVLNHADLTRAKLRGVTLSGAKLENTKLPRTDLTDADFTGADLTNADLSEAVLTNANLSKANLISANLTETNLTTTNLKGADLTGANLTGADLTGADLTGADLSHTDLTGADLTDADLSSADLTGSNIDIMQLLKSKSLTDTKINGKFTTIQKTKLQKKGAALIETANDDTDTDTLVVKSLIPRCGKMGVELGHGTYGVVYMSTNNKCAIKKVRSGKIDENFIRENGILHYLNHPNITSILGIQFGPPLLVAMPLANGTISALDLTVMLTRQAIFYQILRGLAYCHSKSIWHLDLKPDNILYYENPIPIIKLADFGLSQPYIRPSNNNNMNILTYPWRAPEIFADDNMYTENVDVWSVGIMLLNAITNNIFYKKIINLGEKNCFNTLVELTQSLDEYVSINGTLGELPPGWSIRYSRKTGDPYWHNANNNTSTNTMPLPVVIGKDEYDLLRGMLMDKRDRISAITALESDYFDPVREEIEQIIPAPPIIIQTCGQLMVSEQRQINYKTDLSKREQVITYLSKIANKMPNSLFYSILLLDIFASKYSPDDIKLYGLGCIYIGTCLYELHVPKLDDYETPYSVKELENAVKTILTVTDFQIIAASCWEFIKEYIEINSVNTKTVQELLIHAIKKYPTLLPSQQAQLVVEYLSTVMPISLTCAFDDILLTRDITNSFASIYPHKNIIKTIL